MQAPSKYPLIFLLRHGQTEWNAIGRIQGQMESDLSAIGKQHAAAQGDILRQAGVTSAEFDFYASPLRRTRQTAEIAFENLIDTPIFDARLKEVGMGAWEGMMRRDVAQQWPDYYSSLPTALDRCVGAIDGEGFDPLCVRAQAFLDDLPGPAVIVAHGVFNMVLRGLITGLDRQGMSALSAEQGCVIRLENGREEILRQG